MVAVTEISKRRHLVENIAIATHSMAMAVWSFIYLYLGRVPSAEMMEAGIGVLLFACLIILVSMQFALGASAYLRKRRLTIALLLLMVVPLSTLATSYIDPGSGHWFGINRAAPHLNSISGEGVAVVVTYLIVLLFFGMAGILNALFKAGEGIASGHWVLFLILLSSSFVLAYNFSINFPLFPIDSVFAYMVVFNGGVAAYGIMYNRLVFKTVDRDEIVEVMSDGWMLINEQNKIIDLNRTAREILGVNKDAFLGESIDSFQIDLPAFRSTTGFPVDMEMKKSFRTREEVKYFNIRVSTVPFSGDNNLSLVLWRDITNQRKSEDVRQKARDEMFVLLNAASSEASQSATIEEFLYGVIYQIIFSFRSQAAVVYLGNHKENQNVTENQVYSPVSAFGVAEDSVAPIFSGSKAYEFIKDAFEKNEPILVANPSDELRLPAALQTDAYVSILALPLVINRGSDKLNMGVMFLARKEQPAYSSNEILRLGMLADHIANLVDNERRRKLAIAFSERQKLMRDLHDSVSQKLYGLVTLTEAAQATMETGAQIVPQEVLARIGENARQAVKEMRLFLYQMQPVDIEKEGLISVLHHRLAAVEGRADIKAGLLADETIKLQPEKEMALYYIAQEALNNILRHARAANVVVTYRQTKKNVVLKISDDGIGFDVHKVDHSGLGLANMKDRSDKINGNFKLHSRPGKGTIVTISLPREKIQ